MQGLSLGLVKGMWKGEAGKVYSCEYQDERWSKHPLLPSHRDKFTTFLSKIKS